MGSRAGSNNNPFPAHTQHKDTINVKVNHHQFHHHNKSHQLKSLYRMEDDDLMRLLDMTIIPFDI